MSFEEYKSYFKNSGDKKASAFDISGSPYPAMFYPESLEFGSGKHKVRIIDQFNGKRPVLLNHEFCVEEKEIELFFGVSIIMDSNLTSLLHQYATGKQSMRDDVLSATESFLIHVSEIKCDYTPLFYLIESCHKNNEFDFISNASTVLSSILKLHAMNEEQFIATREIIPKVDVLEHYCQLYNANNLDDCGKNWARKFASRKQEIDCSKDIDLSYACLLKMVLIKFEDSKGIYKKSEKFEHFSTEILGVVLARESFLSVYYFANLAGKLLNTQANMKLEDALSSLKATAWDISLLRYPEHFLSPNYLPEITTGYVATSEEKLFDLGKLFTIEHLVYNTNSEQPWPVVSFNMKNINSQLEDTTISKLVKKNTNLAISRLFSNKKPISHFDLKMLIQDLEMQMANLCRG